MGGLALPKSRHHWDLPWAVDKIKIMWVLFVLFSWLLILFLFFEKVLLGVELKVDQAGLELAMFLLPLSPECWDCR